MLKIYSFLACLLSLVVLPVIFVIRLLQGKDVTSWHKKAGNFELPEGFNKAKKTIMIHGVSVGEVVSLEKLVRKIKETYPDFNLVLTTGTKTGQETAIKKMGEVADFITYFPLDVPYAVEKFLNKINPDVVLIAETEIWPVFAYKCSLRKIPVCIINGRMSDESFKSYKFLAPFFRRVLPLYFGIFVQSEIDKERLITVGANKETTSVMKNLKFDVKKFDVDIDLEIGGSKVLIAGSTHKGEDEVVLNVFKKLKEKKDIKLLLAPRHITRTKSVAGLLEKEGLLYNLYSENKTFKGADVLLLDVMGELAKLYAAADVAFIGGSFNKTGGHNPLEAVIFDKPVISGPSVKNFRDIYSILTLSKAGFIVKDEKEFFEVAQKLFYDEEFYKKTQKETKTVFENQQGALDFVIKKVGEILK